MLQNDLAVLRIHFLLLMESQFYVFSFSFFHIMALYVEWVTLFISHILRT